ncbi:MAG: DUF2891 domain-containing protein [Bacteroidetes bacterium]|nr:DUF2891 domain-containing protein [Bacteroidota bacterium]
MKHSFCFLLCVLQLASLSAQSRLTPERAAYLSSFAAGCITKEYPNKPGHVLGSDSSLLPPRIMHPAFYGCFDWHSAVHGHWTLVTLLSRYPGQSDAGEIQAMLGQLLSRENILQEVAYFDDPHNRDFERPYGWAWLLKLDEALAESTQAWTKPLHTNLQPLTALIAGKMNEFLRKLNHPIRVGEHTNIAFAMSLSLDWADKYDQDLANAIRQRARDYFLNDKNCPITWEPGGFDFISPCLQEAALMSKVLESSEFDQWFSDFLPGMLSCPNAAIAPAETPDRSDGKMAHLDGLNFNRAWCLAELATATNNPDLLKLAHDHFDHSFSKMDKGEYAGAHWLASFATMALIKLEMADF